MQIADALRQAAPDDQGSRIAAALSHHSLGAGLAHAGDTAGIAHLRLALADMRELAGRAPNDWSRFQLAATTVELADALFRSNPRVLNACREASAGLAAWQELVARARDRVPQSTDAARFNALAVRCHAN